MNYFVNPRTNRFDAMIRRYGVHFGELNAAIELLSDVRHWCDRRSESFAELDRIAYQRYLAECNGGSHE